MSHGIQMTGTGFSQGTNESWKIGETQRDATQAVSKSVTALLGEAGFSPELVLFIAKSRMDDIDGQVRASMTELDETAARSKELGDQIRALHKLQEQMAGTDNGKILVNGEDGVDSEHNFFTLEDGTRVDTETYLRRVGIEPGDDITLCLTKDTSEKAINSEAVDAMLKGLEEEQQKINTDNEMRMAKLQSLMQQRTQILTLTTNLLQKLDEGTQAILRNLA